MGMLDGKVAIITGATSGIGETTAELFVAEVAQVVFTGGERPKASRWRSGWARARAMWRPMRPAKRIGKS